LPDSALVALKTEHGKVEFTVRYYARIGESEYIIDIEENGTVLVDGEQVAVNLAEGGVNVLYSVLIDGASHEVLIEPSHHDYVVTLKDEQYQVQIEDERTRRLNAHRKLALPQGDISVTAPIPGLVVNVLVEEGQEIAEGQSLVILEAMKMENELRAVRPGKVKMIKVAAGQRVNSGDVLLVVE
jgi:biotin carboxyl carrier protein